MDDTDAACSDTKERFEASLDKVEGMLARSDARERALQQFCRTLGMAAFGGADIKEMMVAAAQIPHDDHGAAWFAGSE